MGKELVNWGNGRWIGQTLVVENGVCSVPSAPYGGLGYRDIEDRIEQAVHIRFGLPPKILAILKKKIKKCDIYCAWFEATQIAGFDPVEADQFFSAPPKGLDLILKPLPVVEAKAAFLARFEALNER